jgi:hypothetical protein
MPNVGFSALPDASRVWVFASDRPLEGGEGEMFLEEVDRFLESWKAHGAPLRCAREWTDDRFLVIGVDPTAEQASGCSIDGMYRVLAELEGRLATGLLQGGRVFYRRRNGKANLALRNELTRLATAGEIGDDTPVFDTTVTTLRDYRDKFERPARETWVGRILAAQASQSSSRAAT